MSAKATSDNIHRGVERRKLDGKLEIGKLDGKIEKVGFVYARGYEKKIRKKSKSIQPGEGNQTNLAR